MDNKDNNIIKQKQFFIDSVAKFCDKCSTAYTTDDVNILQNTNLATIIHFTCNNCKTEHIATFMKGIGISQKVPMNTDLTAKEVNKFSQMGKISLQEVLNLYKYLKENHTESN